MNLGRFPGSNSEIEMENFNPFRFYEKKFEDIDEASNTFFKISFLIPGCISEEGHFVFLLAGGVCHRMPKTPPTAPIQR